MTRKKKKRTSSHWEWIRLLIAIVAGGAIYYLFGCATHSLQREVRGRAGVTQKVTTTAYCPCGTCCGWKRTWYGKPVYTYGPNKGKRKVIGRTSTGTRAHHGTIAADPKVFPYGTIIHVPGYGYGRVEDTGGGLKGRHIDLFFRGHSQAQDWGRQVLQVTVWFPQDKTGKGL